MNKVRLWLNWYQNCPIVYGSMIFAMEAIGTLPDGWLNPDHHPEPGVMNKVFFR